MLSGLKTQTDGAVVLDMRHSDDAGVVRINKSTGLLHTIDVITPIVDEPAAFGRIAAANAVSDVFAMGGTPSSAVSLLSVPSELPRRVVAPILEAAGETLREAGAPLIGGHTLKDRELKLGFAVTGHVPLRRLITNEGAKAGQRLLLTKALGTGILFQAMKKDARSARETKALIASMTALNKRAGEVMVTAKIRCGTDVTGFGLIGHALNIARASGVDLVLEAQRLPALEGVLAHLGNGIYPGTTEANLKGYGRGFKKDRGVSKDAVRLAADPQTSGGMLIVAPPSKVKQITNSIEAWEIGEVQPQQGASAVVRLT